MLTSKRLGRRHRWGHEDRTRAAVRNQRVRIRAARPIPPPLLEFPESVTISGLGPPQKKLPPRAVG